MSSSTHSIAMGTLFIILVAVSQTGGPGYGTHSLEMGAETGISCNTLYFWIAADIYEAVCDFLEVCELKNRPLGVHVSAVGSESAPVFVVDQPGEILTWGDWGSFCVDTIGTTDEHCVFSLFYDGDFDSQRESHVERLEASVYYFACLCQSDLGELHFERCRVYFRNLMVEVGSSAAIAMHDTTLPQSVRDSISATVLVSMVDYSSLFPPVDERTTPYRIANALVRPSAAHPVVPWWWNEQ